MSACPDPRPHAGHTYADGQLDCYGVDEPLELAAPPARRPAPSALELRAAIDGLESVLKLTDFTWMPKVARSRIKGGIEMLHRVLETRDQR